MFRRTSWSSTTRIVLRTGPALASPSGVGIGGTLVIVTPLFPSGSRIPITDPDGAIRVPRGRKTAPAGDRGPRSARTYIFVPSARHFCPKRPFWFKDHASGTLWELTGTSSDGMIHPRPGWLGRVVVLSPLVRSEIGQTNERVGL